MRAAPSFEPDPSGGVLGPHIDDFRRTRLDFPREMVVVVLWEAFYIENKRFDLDTLRVLNRSPTPISKPNDFRRQSDAIWGARGPPFRPILGVPRVRAGLKKTYVLAL